ncbi:MAG: hypothetical protein WA021_03405 [Minisyncoccia bacterium]
MTLVRITVFVSLCAFGSAALVLDNWQTQTQTAFFESVLRNAEISETVTIRGMRYTINADELDAGTDIASTRTYLATLKVAYALTLAQRTPILSIAGTDSTALSAEVVRLEEIVEKLAELQTSEEDRDAVRALYPLQFLKELATLEHYRHAFIASGSDVDSDAYLRQMSKTIDQYAVDLSRFVNYFEQFIGKKSVRIVGLNGVTTPERMLTLLSELQEGGRRAQLELDAQKRCLLGRIAYCKSTLELPRFDVEPAPTTPLPPMVSIIEHFRAGLQGIDATAPHAYVALRSNTCVAVDTPPVFVRVETGTSDPKLPRVRYMEDIFFFRTEGSRGPVLEYLYDTFGIEYSYIAPYNFYVCPESAHVVGDALAVVRIADFARAHPDIAEEEGKKLTDAEALFEEDARSYIHAAIETTRTRPHEERTEVLELARMMRNGSAGLEITVRSIADVLSAHIRKKETGVPFDLSPKHLFITHSAFPSLFLSRNEMFGTTTSLHISEHAADMEKFMTSVRRYSNLRFEIPDAELQRDVYEFLKFEERVD